MTNTTPIQSSDQRITKKPLGLTGTKPAPDVETYGAVPWYRKQEFALFPLLVPITLIIVLTGDVFFRATDQTREYSDANVWRFGAAARAFVAAVCILVTLGVASLLG